MTGREERQGDVLRESLGHRTCDVDESKYYSEMALDVQVVIVQISDLSQLHPMSPQRKLCCTHAVPRHRPQCSREVDREGNVVFVHRKSSSRYDVVLIQSDRERKRA